MTPLVFSLHFLCHSLFTFSHLPNRKLLFNTSLLLCMQSQQYVVSNSRTLTVSWQPTGSCYDLQVASTFEGTV